MGNHHSNVENPAPIYIGYGRRLSEKVPISAIQEQVVALRRTFQDVGAELFPEEHINVAQMAVSFAAREILSPEVYEQIKERNFLEGASRGGLAHMPDGHMKNGATEKVENKTEWGDAETSRLMELAAMKEYEYPSGMHKGSPCFSMICAVLNNEFHAGEHVRNGMSCMRKHSRALNPPPPRNKGAKRISVMRMPEGFKENGNEKSVEVKTKWSDEEARRLLELAALEKYTYQAGAYEGNPCFEMICDVLNGEFHDEERVRNRNNCLRKYLRLTRALEQEAIADIIPADGETVAQ